MANKYCGIYELKAKADLLNFLELLWVIDKRRFSRKMLMEQLNVPFSIARAFSKGKDKNVFNCYRKLADVDIRIISAVLTLVNQIEQARAVDRLLEKPTVEGGFYKDTRTDR